MDEAFDIIKLQKLEIRDDGQWKRNKNTYAADKNKREQKAATKNADLLIKKNLIEDIKKHVLHSSEFMKLFKPQIDNVEENGERLRSEMGSQLVRNSGIPTYDYCKLFNSSHIRAKMD